MGKKRAIGFATIAFLLTAAIWCFTAHHHPPRYKGKTVAELSRLVGYSRASRGLVHVTDEQVEDALHGLHLLGPQAEESLSNQLQTRDTLWRRCYKSLWLRAPSIAKPLLPRYVEALPLRQSAASALGKLGTLTPRSEHALVLACRDADFIVREKATLILGYRGTRCPETLQALKETLRDPQMASRVASGGPALEEFDFRPRTVEEMAKDLSRPFDEARYQAAAALRDLGAKASPAIPALISACEDSYAPVRICCASALGRIGVPATNALPVLQRMSLNDETSLVRSAAAEAVQRIRNPLAGGASE